MSKATRKANAEARRIIKFTRRVWNPAQVAAWAGEPGAVARWEVAHEARFDMALARIKAGARDGGRLRRALRRAEVKG